MSKHKFELHQCSAWKHFTCLLVKKTVILLIVFMSMCVHAQSVKNAQLSNDKLIDQYIQSKGSNIISFDATNIKQFWTDNSVVTKNDYFEINLNNSQSSILESKPLTIQLANVIESLDCKIEIISLESDLAFSISNSKSKTLSESSPQETFIHYSVDSSSFHLEDLDDFSFHIIFHSKAKRVLSIKKIILSFSDNKNSLYKGISGYNSLLERFETEGKVVPNSDVLYIVDKDLNKVFIRILEERAYSNRFFFHLYPTDSKDVTPDRVQYGFNNKDFYLKERNATVFQKPFGSNSKYAIMQIEFPTYPCSLFRIGQYNSNGRLWGLDIKDINF